MLSRRMVYHLYMCAKKGQINGNGKMTNKRKWREHKDKKLREIEQQQHKTNTHTHTRTCTHTQRQ